MAKELCKTYYPFSPWMDTFGEKYSDGLKILPEDDTYCNESESAFMPVYMNKVVLIADALSYSASDILATGFIDNNIRGHVLCTSENTGAGGGNVWRHSALRHILPYSDLKPLPKKIDFTVALRKAVRIIKDPGDPKEHVEIECIGIKENLDSSCIHEITLNDLLDGNTDLIDKALELLNTDN